MFTKREHMAIWVISRLKWNDDGTIGPCAWNTMLYHISKVILGYDPNLLLKKIHLAFIDPNTTI